MIPLDANSDAIPSRYRIEIDQAQGAVFGDSNIVINHFTVGMREPPTDYAVRVKNFLVEYLGLSNHPVPFGGRTEDLARLDAWLDDPEAPPYLLLAAPAGRGKSALLARWSQALTQRDDRAIAYFQIGR